MPAWHNILIRKLKEHSRLSAADLAAIRRLPHTERDVVPGKDIVRQGDRPKVSVVVLKGMVARYHTLRGGRRQYLSLHIPGDMPDVQSLFLDQMDHAVCAMDDVVVALVPQKALLALFDERPQIGFAFWRETLIDAAIFREAITNNGARPLRARLAHFFASNSIAPAKALSPKQICAGCRSRKPNSARPWGVAPVYHSGPAGAAEGRSHGVAQR